MSTAIAEQITHQLVVLDESGDSKIIWDADNQDEVDAAKSTFDSLRKKGYVAYSVNRKGDAGEVMTKFDPSVEKVILAPQLKGG